MVYIFSSTLVLSCPYTRAMRGPRLRVAQKIVKFPSHCSPPNLIPVLVFVIKVISWIRPQSLNQTTPPFIWFYFDKILKIFYQRKQDWAMQNEGRSLGIFFVGVFYCFFWWVFYFWCAFFFFVFAPFVFCFCAFFAPYFALHFTSLSKSNCFFPMLNRIYARPKFSNVKHYY